MKLTFTGDLAIDRPFLNGARTDGQTYDFGGCFDNVVPVFRQSDLVVGNLETVFCGSKVPYNKGLHYNTPDAFLDEIKRAGIDFVTTANNHCYDGGEAGLLRTLYLLNERGISHTGTFTSLEEKRYLVLTVGGIRVAILSLTYGINNYGDRQLATDVCAHVNLLKPFREQRVWERWITKYYTFGLRRTVNKLLKKPTIRTYQDQLYSSCKDETHLAWIRKQISAAKAESDYVVACIHIGGQFNETPGAYSDFMVQFLQGVGVDAIIGNHPHTVQKAFVEGTTAVGYSLGGLCLSPSAIYIDHACKPEYSMLLHLYIDETSKRIEKATFSLVKGIEDEKHRVSVHPITQLYQFADDQEKQTLAADAAALYYRITGKDFPGMQDEYAL